MQKSKKYFFTALSLILSLVCCFSIFSFNSQAEESKYYIISDSRGVGMKNVDSNDNHIYSAEVSKGYSFLEKTIDTVLNQATDGDFIVVSLGANDLHNKKKYVNLINEITGKTSADVIVMTVGPVDYEKGVRNGYSISNEGISEFNGYLKDNLNSDVKIIDVYEEFTSKGFNTTDGIHYTNDTSRALISLMDGNGYSGTGSKTLSDTQEDENEDKDEDTDKKDIEDEDKDDNEDEENEDDEVNEVSSEDIYKERYYNRYNTYSLIQTKTPTINHYSLIQFGN